MIGLLGSELIYGKIIFFFRISVPSTIWSTKSLCLRQNLTANCKWRHHSAAHKLANILSTHLLKCHLNIFMDPIVKCSVWINVCQFSVKHSQRQTTRPSNRFRQTQFLRDPCKFINGRNFQNLFILNWNNHWNSYFIIKWKHQPAL